MVKKHKLVGRYQLEEEIESEKLYRLYQGSDTRENKPVIISLLTEVAMGMPLENLLRYRKIQEKLKGLSHRHLLNIVDTVEEEGNIYVISETVTGKSLDRCEGLTGEEKISVIKGIAEALDIIHQHKILHGHLNSGNILIAGDKTGKLSGCGLNLLIDLTKVAEEGEIKKVFGYLSPEGSGILRKPVDYRSDLYSLGIIFYELLTNRLPYRADEVADLIHQHIAEIPEEPCKINPEIPIVINKIILKLMAKDPQDRYQTVTGFISDLEEYQRKVADCKGQIADGKSAEGEAFAISHMPHAISNIDFEIARQDRLKELNFSTRLIGRDKELQALKSNVRRATAGQGSVSLVHGEAGIGKSRLIDELRGYVHELHGIFAGGKCYQYEFRTPYKVIEEAIEAYIEKVKRQSQKEQQKTIIRIKGVLGELGGEAVKIAPTLKELIGEPPALVALEPEKEKIRFLITITNFIISLSSKENPLLLFLDDLQWVDDGSLEILERVIQKVSESALILIIGYRSNEVDEEHILAKMLKKFVDSSSEIVEKTENDQATTNYQLQTTNSIQEFPLKHFDLKETATMISQILLESEEQMLYLVENLYERTKGNPFFTLELLRTLHEEKIIYLQDNHYRYNQEKLGHTALPTNIVDIVLKRMQDIPEEEKHILSAAAVMGKEIDLNILTQLSQKPFEHILNVIEHSIENQLLYRDITGKEDIYFIHDRVREIFYERIPEEEKAPMHGYIAEAIEIQHQNNVDEVLYDLAFHYTKGKVEEKSLQYCLKAAKQAQASYSNVLAINLYLTTKGILEKQQRTRVPEYMDILENLGEVYRLAGKFEESLTTLKSCQELIPEQNKIHKTRVLSKMGDTLWEKGETREAAAVLEKALAILNTKIPKTNIEVF